MNVLSEYMRIAGIEPDENRDRQATIELIKSKLQNFSPYDAQLIATETIEDDSIEATWLRGNRKPLNVHVEFNLRIPAKNHYVGNLTQDKGGARKRFDELLAEYHFSNVAVDRMLHEGFSFNEVIGTLAARRYAVQIGTIGSQIATDGIKQIMVQGLPAIRVSVQPRSKGWWQFWKKETADLRMSKIIWELTAEEVRKLELPVLPVRMPLENAEPEIDLTTRIMRDYPQQ